MSFPAFGDFIKECCDLSYENMGKPNSYVFYGPNWARAGAGHLRVYKGFPVRGRDPGAGIRPLPRVRQTSLAHRQVLCR